MAFQDNLKHFREKAGFTAKEFADLLEVPYGTYVSYENRAREPKYELLIKIADALHVSIDDLLGYKPDEMEQLIQILKKNDIPFSTVKTEDQLFCQFDIPGTNTSIVLGLAGLKQCMEEVKADFEKQTAPQFKNAFMSYLIWTYKLSEGDKRVTTYDTQGRHDPQCSR